MRGIQIVYNPSASAGVTVTKRNETKRNSPADMRRQHTYQCPECGATVRAEAKHHVRQQTRCRACIRKANGWACDVCGSDDPYHASPCF